MCLMGSLCLMDNYDIKAHEYPSNGFLMPTGVNSKRNGLILYYTSIFFMLLKCIIVYRSVIDHILLLLYLKQMHGLIPFQCHPNRSIQTRRWRCCSLPNCFTNNKLLCCYLVNMYLVRSSLHYALICLRQSCHCHVLYNQRKSKCSKLANYWLCWVIGLLIFIIICYYHQMCNYQPLNYQQ